MSHESELKRERELEIPRSRLRFELAAENILLDDVCYVRTVLRQARELELDVTETDYGL